jgi:hypothetical protein
VFLVLLLLTLAVLFEAAVIVTERDGGPRLPLWGLALLAGLALCAATEAGLLL